MIQCDGKPSGTIPGRVPNRIGDRTGRSGYRNLPYALDAERVDMRVVLFDENGVE